MAFFKAKNISISFGGLKALNRVCFDVNKGEIFSIIGPNGAGKTTIFNCINRFYDLDEGSFYLEDHDISRIKPHAVAGMGIARNTLIVHMSDVLIAFPGKYGTLNEIACALALQKTVIHLPGVWDLRKIAAVDHHLFKEAFDARHAIGLALTATTPSDQ